MRSPGDPGSPIVEIEGLTRRFGPVVALAGLDLEIARGEVFGLLGPNGAGKTTTLRLLTGIVRPTGGTARILGIDVVRSPELVKSRIGYVAQAFGLYGDLTVEENARFYASLYGPPDRVLLDALMDRYGFSALRGRLARDLSGGYRTRLALITALAHGPDLLFLDEPTCGIDPVTRKELWDLFYALKGQGRTLVVTTHYMEEAERCDRLAFIFGGRLIALGSPRELRAVVADHEVFDLSTAYRPGVVERVSALPEVDTVNQLGPVLRLLCHGGCGAAESLTRAVAPLGIGRDDIRRGEATLEDVFVLLTRAGARVPEPPARAVASVRATASVPVPARHPRGGLRALVAVVRKEFIHLQREPRLLALLVGTPVVLLVLFGYALRLTVENLTVAVWDQSRSVFSLELKDRLRSEAGFTLIEVGSEAAITGRITSGEAHLGVVIPSDFSRRMMDNLQTRVRVFVDGTMPVLAQAAFCGAGVLTGDDTARALTFEDPDHPAPPVRPRPIALERVILFNPGLRDSDFFLPGTIGIVIMQVSLIIASVGFVREKEQRTLEQLLVTPISRLALVGGKLVPYLLIAAVDFAMVLTIGHLVFDLPLRGSFGAIVLLAILFIVALLSLGGLISTLSETQPQAIFMSVFVLIPSILLSGFVFPVEAMPHWLQPVSWLFPLTYYLEAVRGLMLKGVGALTLLRDFGALAGFLVVFGTASLLRMRKRLF
jgi:ABC-type multidrug transport system ATPase subunit/ABC-type multidrug transport system permease subunit